MLWLWCRPVATGPIQPLAWELPYAARRCSPRKGKKTKKKKKKNYIRQRLGMRIDLESQKAGDERRVVGAELGEWGSRHVGPCRPQWRLF